MLLSAAHQRRLIVAAVVLFQSGDWGGGWKKRLPAVSWVDHVARLNEAEFKQRYRLSSDSFYKLRDILRPELDTASATSKMHSTPGPVSRSSWRRAWPAPCDSSQVVTLVDLKLIYCMSKMQVMRCVWSTVDAIIRGCAQGGQARQDGPGHQGCMLHTPAGEHGDRAQEAC